ncbi:UDP-2,3-diacylglucosamine diphosphatase [Wenzhouxiangella marina]|uniref:UDP-2,3-diacylglucosamine diphosphatase n=1 Tax=Wenzhouxiangella marina TaxID=1579979 RepID=UPI00247FC0E5|nr:UDP-2,3-diacylglucosamine diphosphatase [Wenzhouxiangella marina]
MADLHLDGDRSGTTKLLLDFLSGPGREARALYILGDLFEAWIGDDAMLPPAAAVATALRELGDHGVAVHFLAGNRDFLLGPAYCEHAGMTLLEAPVLLELAGGVVLLLHGDGLCTDDEEYQRFRKRVRNPEWQARMLARPIWFRRLLARLARALSQRRNRNKPAAIMDVNAQAVEDCMLEHGVRLLIHGHTHRPAIHDLDFDGEPGHRVVLGDWRADKGSAVRLDAAGVSLLELLPGEAGDVELTSVDQRPLPWSKASENG